MMGRVKSELAWDDIERRAAEEAGIVMNVEYELMTPGEDGWSAWIHPLPGYLMQCCDCGLVHEMEFAIVPRSDVAGNGPVNEGETDAALILFRARRQQN